VQRVRSVRRRRPGDLMILCVMLLGSPMASADAPVQASSGSSTASMSVCRAIKDPANRLKCYDNLPSASVPPSGASAPIQAAANVEKVVTKWSGSSNMQTRPFHVDGPWELQWNTAKGYFSATLHRTSGHGPTAVLLANGTESGSSSSYQPVGGDFYVEFGAMQPWSARVVALPAPASSKDEPTSEEPLLNVSGDQSGIPPCNGPGASDEIKKLVENSPLGQMTHLSVIHVGDISSRPRLYQRARSCHFALITNCPIGTRPRSIKASAAACRIPGYPG
jgi:hypothetical protein